MYSIYRCWCEGGMCIHIISGEYKDTKGAVECNYVNALVADVEIEPKVRWTFETNQEDTIFVYIVEGSAWFGDTKYNLQMNKQVVLFNPGDELIVQAGDKGVRFILFLATPLRETVAYNGPFVMSTCEELEMAFQDLKTGNFIKKCKCQK